MVTVYGKSVKNTPVPVNKRMLDCYYKSKQHIAEGVGTTAVLVCFGRCATRVYE